VSSLSKDYFHYYSSFNLLLVPLSEGNFLLHLPDLCHELAHPLLLDKHNPKTKLFQHTWLQCYSIILEYILSEQKKEDRRRSPRLFGYYLKQWEKSWMKWLIEFYCDLYAVYAVGPAFAWSHLHLWMKLGNNPFIYPTSQPVSHPADDARMQAVLAALKISGFSHEASEIQSRWKAFLDISGFRPEPEYNRCFPIHIIEKIASATLEGYQAMNCRLAVNAETGSISKILNQAWDKFWEDPINYATWERHAISELKSQTIVSNRILIPFT